jgi:hypothetical protein
MLERFRELRGQGTFPSERARTQVYPDEFYLFWYRLNTLRRELVSRWQTVPPELERDAEELDRELLKTLA